MESGAGASTVAGHNVSTKSATRSGRSTPLSGSLTIVASGAERPSSDEFFSGHSNCALVDSSTFSKHCAQPSSNTTLSDVDEQCASVTAAPSTTSMSDSPLAQLAQLRFVPSARTKREELHSSSDWSLYLFGPQQRVVAFCLHEDCVKAGERSTQ